MTCAEDFTRCLSAAAAGLVGYLPRGLLLLRGGITASCTPLQGIPARPGRLPTLQRPYSTRSYSVPKAPPRLPREISTEKVPPSQHSQRTPTAFMASTSAVSLSRFPCSVNSVCLFNRTSPGTTSLQPLPRRYFPALPVSWGACTPISPFPHSTSHPHPTLQLVPLSSSPRHLPLLYSFFLHRAFSPSLLPGVFGGVRVSTFFPCHFCHGLSICDVFLNRDSTISGVRSSYPRPILKRQPGFAGRRSPKVLAIARTEGSLHGRGVPFFRQLCLARHLFGTSSPHAHIRMQLNRAARVLLVGAPGVGKGTQSERLLKRFPQLQAISTGDLLRTNVNNRTPLGTLAPDRIHRHLLRIRAPHARTHRNPLTC